MTAAWPLYGHRNAQDNFLSAHASGRLHHGWLLQGPSGIGKALFAKRVAAFLLGAKGTDAAALEAPSTDPIVQKFEAEAHPDLRWVKRELNDRGKLRQDISIEQIRNLNQFFTLKPALGGWRVGVIDAIDEMNRNGLNALLKTLEEPPPQCMLLLVNHGTLPVLATIRSRCRVLRFSALDKADTDSVLSGMDGAPREAASLARGRPGHGLRLASPAGMASANAARSLLRALPGPSDAALTAAIKQAGSDEIAFEAFCAEVLEWLADKADGANTAATLWLDVSRLAGETAALNMVRSEAAAKIVAGLQKMPEMR